MFNLEQRGRVGLPVPKYIRLDDDGRIIARYENRNEMLRSERDDFSVV